MDGVRKKVALLHADNDAVWTSQEELESYGLRGMVLRDYQIEGVSWIARCCLASHGCILGDEMGLGKTIQTIAFLIYQQRKHDCSGPFLILCPLSVLMNWHSEISRFGCEMAVMLFTGDKDTREGLKESIARHIKSQGTGWKRADLNFNVLLTTYEICIKESSFLSRVHWRTVVVDEAHRLKNPNSVFHQELSQFERDFSVLLTGTPVQNNLQELYSLLSFIAPDIFGIELMQEFVEEYRDVSSSGRSSKLQSLLAPFLLRRVKSQVVLDLPKKSEVVIYTGLSDLQKKYYKAILMKDAESFATDGPSRMRLMNILMQLRKCVNHPYLFDGVEPEPFQLGEHLIRASGKLTVIDHLLEFLKERGHKVLMFSQMTRMLDIIQDYLGYRGYLYERLDGSVRGEERYLAVQNFNETEDTFIFLLSTKAGGQGLNLTAADTIIFVDSDFNPQNDLQAAARAHRIGQARPVKVIRLVTRSTVEEIVLSRAHDKLNLTRAVIEGGKFSGKAALSHVIDSPSKLTDILKFGLDKLFETDQGISNQTDATNRNDVSTPLPINFNEILGETSNGQWINEKTLGDDALNTRDAKAAKTEVSHMYMYEGRDYSSDPSGEDRTAFDKLLADTISELTAGERQLRSEGRTSLAQPTGLVGQKRKTLTPEELELRREKRKEAAAKRAKLKELDELRKAQKRRQTLEKLWKENNYNTMNICLDADEEEDDADEQELGSDGDEDQTRDVQFVRGDVTHPINTSERDAIVVHCVDDSGKWGQGGLFTAISESSSLPQKCYELAAEMKDLSLGDAHLVPFDDQGSSDDTHHHVALIVAQSRDRKYRLSAIKLPALSQGLVRVARAAKNLQASVHLPRIGHSTPNFNWYGTERLIRKHLVTKGVPTFIYYFPRGARSSSSAVSRPQPCASPKSSAHRTEGKATDKTRSHATTSTGRPCVTKALPDFMTGVTVCFEGVPDEQKRKLRRYLLAYNGDVVHFRTGDVTHVVGEASLPEDVSGQQTSSPGPKLVATAWLYDSFRKGRRLDTKPYELRR